MKVLFQGDSITDAGRSREKLADLGPGYPAYAAALMTEMFPQIPLTFVNRGISGNRTEHLVQRLQADFIDIAPDLIIMMIGVNDVWHHYSHNIETTDEAFEANLRHVLSEIKAKTSAKLVMIEPYLLPAADKAHMVPELHAKIRIERTLAREFADAYIPLDGLFASACVVEDYTKYSPDGVHPNADGARLIAKHVMSAVIPMLEKSISVEDGYTEQAN
ncbi:MAG: SGNH/GDSL hydrolase family protein [Clostridia bacterium]|nr:SGNH/GDSL hydrolase family protein [Clostridia bacterium]